MNKQNQRRTRAVKCPACGKIKKTRATNYFKCCGSAWDIESNLIQKPPSFSFSSKEEHETEPQTEQEEIKELREDKQEEIDPNEPEPEPEPESEIKKTNKRIGKRQREIERKRIEEQITCPTCGGDLWELKDTPDMFYCDECDGTILIRGATAMLHNEIDAEIEEEENGDGGDEINDD